MSRFVAVLSVFSAFALAAESPPVAQTSVGAASEEEARILLKDSKDLFSRGECKDAIPKLERLVDRYPGKSGYLETQRMLGICRYKAGRFKSALSPLKHYAQAIGKVPARDETKLWIGKTHLALKQFNEAYLVSREIVSSDPTDSLQIDALILQSQARAGMKQDVAAGDSIESARLIIQKNRNIAPETKARLALAELELKRKECGKLASAPSLTEAQAIEQYDRRGACLLEATLFARKSIEQAEPETRKLAVQALGGAFEDYRAACDNPPGPATEKGRKPLSSAERKRYVKELGKAFAARYKTFANQARSTMAEFKDVVEAIP